MHLLNEILVKPSDPFLVKSKWFNSCLIGTVDEHWFPARARGTHAVPRLPTARKSQRHPGGPDLLRQRRGQRDHAIVEAPNQPNLPYRVPARELRGGLPAEDYGGLLAQQRQVACVGFCLYVLPPGVIASNVIMSFCFRSILVAFFYI